jgi:hypothetical protein
MTAPRPLLLAVWCALGSIACGHHDSVAISRSQSQVSAAGIWWSPTLHLSAGSTIDARLEAPFEAPIGVVKLVDGRIGDNKVMTNCLSYFSLRNAGYEPESDGDTAAMKLEGAKCQTVLALRDAKPARLMSLEGFRLDDKALESLPPALGPESNPTDLQAREDATRLGTSWHAYDPLARIGHVASPQEVKVTTDQSTTEITVLARADFSGDGADDILIQTLSFGVEGSWREVRLRLLTRDEGKEVLKIVRDFPL